MAKYLPKASVITRHNIKLLCDTNGGLIYYNPVLDRYASNDYFDDYVSSDDLLSTIEQRAKAKAEVEAQKSGPVWKKYVKQRQEEQIR